MYLVYFRFIINVPKLRHNIIELIKFFLEQLSIIFPKINVYIQPQTIKCHFNIMEYDSS